MFLPHNSISRDSKLTKRKKINSGSICSLVRFRYIHTLAESQVTFFETVSDFGVWSVLEPGMGIVANSLATLRPMMRFFMQRSRSIYSKRYSRGTGASGLDVSGSKSTDNSSKSKKGTNKSGSTKTHQEEESEEEKQFQLDSEHGVNRGGIIDEEKGFKKSAVMIQERNGSNGRLAIMTRTDLTVDMQLGVLPSPPPSSDWQQPQITGLGSNRVAAKSESSLSSIPVPFRLRTDALAS